MPKLDFQFILVLLAAVLPSLTIHEFAHALIAYKFGDNTAKSMGRLTLNPIAHIDILGTIILPLFFRFGYAKPVPVNFSVLKGWQILLVSLAGPISNICLALILTVAYHILPLQNLAIVKEFILIGVLINIVFAIFNLIPIPPLDGSRLVYALLKSPRAKNIYRHFSQFGVFIIFGLIYLSATGKYDVFSRVIDPVLRFFFNLLKLPRVL